MNTRIARVQTFPVHYPTAGHFKFFRQPAGRPPGRPTVVVKITTDDGSVGWGQCVPSPRWSYETVETVTTTIEGYLAPEIVGLDAFDVPALHAVMNQAIAPSFSTGQPIAKAGIDLALLDLAGKIAGQNVCRLWGRTGLERIELSWTLNPPSLDEAEALVGEALERGYRSFNVKVAPDPTADLELCRLLRQWAPNAFIWVDANGGYDESSARTVAPRLADLGIAALEQPFPANRLSNYRRLRKLGALPILMDEGIVSRADLDEFLQLDLLDGVAMKVARCGGLTEAYRILERVEESGLLFFGSGLTDPDLALAASLILFSAFRLSRPAALNGPQFLTNRILETPLLAHNGWIQVPTGPGLGVVVKEAEVKATALRGTRAPTPACSAPVRG